MARSSGDFDSAFSAVVYEVETGTRFDIGLQETAVTAKTKFFATLIGCYPWLIAALSTPIYAPLLIR